MTKDTADRIVTSLSGVSRDEWHEFFETLRQQQYQQIRSSIAVDQLLIVKSNVKAFDLLENIFTDILKNKKFPLTTSQK